MKKKVCMKCKLFVDGSICPVCKGNRFSINWQGRLYILDSDNSQIASKIDINVKGEYAIKAR